MATKKTTKAPAKKAAGKKVYRPEGGLMRTGGAAPRTPMSQPPGNTGIVPPRTGGGAPMTPAARPPMRTGGGMPAQRPAAPPRGLPRGPVAGGRGGKFGGY